MIKLKQLRKKFKDTLLEVSDILDIPLDEITRDDYIRITVDTGVDERLNKEELNAIGGFSEAKSELLDELADVEKPRIAVVDIESLPLTVWTWGLFKQNIALNQIKEDWSVLSWAFKWFREDEVFYKDQRNAKDIRNDKDILVELHGLLSQASVILTQNGKSFDLPKLNARFLMHGLKPLPSLKHIDTLVIAKKHFGFTSNKLEYMTSQFCTKNKKSSHKKFPGFELWKECMNGNSEAYAEMENYNKMDILSLEELAEKLLPFDNSVNFDLFHENNHNVCSCGSVSFKRNGFYYTSVAKYRRYQCTKCGAESRGRKNLITKEKRDKLKIRTNR